MIWVLMAVAQAGYGDPIAGVPSYDERSLHLWTNRVRIDPTQYADQYDCPFGGFTASEQTQKLPLKWNPALGLVARSHSEDMADNDNLSHTSSDGTPFVARVMDVYDGYVVGENVAFGYPDPYSVMVQGWMCSSGHRSNIMDADFDELGTGTVDDYWTQDFGNRAIDPGMYAARLGVHEPEHPTDSASYTVAVHTSDGPAARIDVVINDTAHTMDAQYKSDDGMSGIYSATLPVDAACTHYWFEVERLDGRVDFFPEGGAYGFGDCAWTDADARWTAAADLPDLTEPTADEIPAGCGCSTSGSPGMVAWLPLLLVARRRHNR